MVKKGTKKTKVKAKTAAKKAEVIVFKEKPKPKIGEEKVKKVKSISGEELVEKVAAKKRTYLFAVGRRKSGIAQVKIYKNGKGVITVNGKDYRQYFPFFEFQEIINAPLRSVGQSDKLDVEVKINGGGKRGQAEAIRLGISRALIKLNQNFKKNLRRAGFLTRDARVKERKKYGLKRARRAPQWQKR